MVAKVELLLDTSADDAADGVNELLRELQRHFTASSCLVDYRIEGFRAAPAKAEQALASGGYEEGLAFAGGPREQEALAAVSTVHLSDEGRQWLESGMQGAVGYPNEYGGFMYVGEASQVLESGALPAEVGEVVAWAREHGLVWVKFDADGCEVEGLRRFD